MKTCLYIVLVWGLLAPSVSLAIEPKDRVKAAIDYLRGTTSYTEAQMTIHRPSWERTSSLRAWTKGRKSTLVRFTAPAKDAGNASLTVNDEMWSFSPKVNRVIKLPSSMMNQSWMGSDFSYNDLSKGDELIDDYTHKFLPSDNINGQKVDVVECVPLESAPVVWGKEIIRIRADNIILSREFYDQDMRLTKRLSALKVIPVSGRLLASHIRMENLETGKEGEWTEVVHSKAEFDVEIPSSLFTISSLQNPRE